MKPLTCLNSSQVQSWISPPSFISSFSFIFWKNALKCRQTAGDFSLYWYWRLDEEYSNYKFEPIHQNKSVLLFLHRADRQSPASWPSINSLTSWSANIRLCLCVWFFSKNPCLDTPSPEIQKPDRTLTVHSSPASLQRSRLAWRLNCSSLNTEGWTWSCNSS